MPRVTEKFYADHTPAILQYLQEHPGCYQVWEIHRAVAIESSYLPFQTLLHRLSQENHLEKRRLNGAQIAYCLPGYEGATRLPDASYYARLKIAKFLPGTKPQPLDKLCGDIRVSRSTLLPVLKQLVAEGQVELIVGKNRFKQYRWIGEKNA